MTEIDEGVALGLAFTKQSIVKVNGTNRILM